MVISTHKLETRVMKKLAAIIIEDRPVDNLGKACFNHLKHLPKDTDLFIYTSKRLKKHSQNNLQSLI